MNVFHRLLWIAAGIAVAVTIACGQGISIAGPQGHSISETRKAADSNGNTIPYWSHQANEQSQSAPSGRAVSNVRFGSSIRYGSGFKIRRGYTRRGPFRYYHPDYSRQRFADLKPNQQGVRFNVSWSNYDSGIKYTTSFRGRKRFGSSIRYGFR